MRRPLVAGNWKMNGTLAETEHLLSSLTDAERSLRETVDLLVIPPFTALARAAEILSQVGSRIALGAQDLHWEPKGAYTGEVSPAMLRDAGCTHVLVGHSERRTHFAEEGETLLRKLRAALDSDLVPVFCLGENLAEREGGRTEAILDRQLAEVLFQLAPEPISRVILAYEPVWAIGTGRTATPEQAREAHRQIRRRIGEIAGDEIAEGMRILYGGSVNGTNAADLLQQDGVDGALVGGASLRGEEFLSIARAAVG